ncbi:hypothetical protein O9H85_11410 [Paenibacillus filicis]|uniref:Uncharacterized protein n=1 Tax=Paenibacillus gyeongsangnamensis TaxID=3388067 RepID=A0ABT4Q824_9BACL|nr:hypothetical protein [Paenibacillus filicis]MCZ8513018.1 hypothetical protein [Paenibacillus filicis]
MWECVLKRNQLEIQMNSEGKSIRLFWRGHAETDRPGDATGVELTQSDMFELMHTFLSINRTFNEETMYFEEPSIVL